MSNPEAAEQHPQNGDVDAAAAETPVAEDAAGEAEPPMIVEETEQRVSLQRSVRYGRLLVVGAVIGAVIAMCASLMFPVDEEALYTMSQIVGFMAIIGAAIGLAVSGILALVLGLVARRKRGTGVAIQADVR
ncbi:MAG: hypothetical protein ACK5LO_10770 [Leucobacter sp.]